MTSKKKIQSMSDTPSTLRRRLLTGGVAAGLSMPLIPTSWNRPVVESVLLPAHAQTSGPSSGPCGPVSGTGCIAVLLNNEGYADFNGGNYLPIGTEVFPDEGCGGDSTLTLGRSIVFAPEGEEQAECLCQENAGVPVGFQEIGDVWFCDNR